MPGGPDIPEIVDRHHLDGVDAKRIQVWQHSGQFRKSRFTASKSEKAAAEFSGVEFVNDQAIQRWANIIVRLPYVIVCGQAFRADGKPAAVFAIPTPPGIVNEPVIRLIEIFIRAWLQIQINPPVFAAWILKHQKCVARSWVFTERGDLQQNGRHLRYQQAKCR